MAISMLLSSSLQLDIPGIQLSSETVVGNILYEQSMLVSLVMMLLVVMIVAWKVEKRRNISSDGIICDFLLTFLFKFNQKYCPSPDSS